jgi:hypothetical protein
MRGNQRRATCPTRAQVLSTHYPGFEVFAPITIFHAIFGATANTPESLIIRKFIYS